MKNMFTDNKDFYPTPKSVIEKMISGLDLSLIHSILEPSAGKGDIVDSLKRKEKEINTNLYKNISLDIDCIEKDKNLQFFLKGKELRVVHDDFLTYDTMKEYDLIIMNPPFSNGCKHLLKALEMQQENGGAVVCLLNAETLKNPCTNDRITLKRKLEDYHADIKYIEDAFIDGERKAAVETALIKVQLPKVQKKSFILEGLKKDEYENEYEFIDGTYLVENDFLKAIVSQYKAEVEAGVKLIKEYYAMQSFILSEFVRDETTGETVQKGGCMLSMTLGGYNKEQLSVNGFIQEVRRKYWRALFSNQQFIGQLTWNLQREYYEKIEELKDYDFSLYNIYQIKIDMTGKVAKGIEDTIVGLFEELSNKYHWYDETSNNIHYYNGWKTNKSYIINKKVIIPLAGFRDLAFSWGGYKPTAYDVVSKLKDMEKCFNYLDGGLTEALDLESSLKIAEANGTTKNVRLKYFNVTFYKKGTCHITFINDELLKKFNIFGSQHKGWLPPTYGKKKYKDMTKEEQEVINDFEGEQEYNKVMSDTNYYLFDEKNLNLLEMKSA